MHSNPSPQKALINQYYFLLLPMKLSLKGFSHTNHKRTYNYKLALKKGQQQFDETKTPVSISGGMMDSALNFDRNHILCFFIPVFNPHRKIQFTLKLNADYQVEDQYNEVGSCQIQSNQYIESYNQMGKKFTQLKFSFGDQWELQSQLYVDHTRQACQTNIKQRYPDLYNPMKTQTQRSHSQRRKTYSAIGVSFSKTYTPNKHIQKQNILLKNNQNNQKDQNISIHSNFISLERTQPKYNQTNQISNSDEKMKQLQEEKVKQPQEEKMKQPQEEKVKLPQEEKVKQTEEQKVQKKQQQIQIVKNQGQIVQTKTKDQQVKGIQKIQVQTEQAKNVVEHKIQQVKINEQNQVKVPEGQSIQQQKVQFDKNVIRQLQSNNNQQNILKQLNHQKQQNNNKPKQQQKKIQIQRNPTQKVNQPSNPKPTQQIKKQIQKKQQNNSNILILFILVLLGLCTLFYPRIKQNLQNIKLPKYKKKMSPQTSRKKK